MSAAGFLRMLAFGLATAAAALRAPAQNRLQLQACIDSCSSALAKGDLGNARQQAREALSTARGLGDSAAVADVLTTIGRIELLQGEYGPALSALQHALRIHDAGRNDRGRATVLNAIGSIHYYDRDFERARSYYQQSLALHQLHGEPAEIAMLSGNLGSVLEELGKPDSALAFHRKHLAMRKSLGQASWLPICYSNLGSCFDKLGVSDSALHYLERSVALHAADDADGHNMATSLIMLGLARLHAGQPQAALRECRQALAVADRTRDRVMVEEACRCLYLAHRRLGDAAQALAMHERYVAMRDSLSGEQRAKELLRLELNYHFENERLADSLRAEQRALAQRFDAERLLARQQYEKRIFLFSAIGVLLLAGALWSRLRYIRRSRALVQQERDRSEKLLLSILPAPIAEELKATGRAAARDVEGATILFTDFHDFTRMSERLSAKELVAEIDACYRAFDAICARHGLEKIKTIGDAYMCAGGLPEPRPGSARDTVLAALEMQRWLKGRASERQAKGLPAFAMRAGIHTGAVVAGVVGDSKFQYDVWGDSVNTAAHMQSAGAVDEVNISEATFLALKDEPSLRFSPRGRLAVKGKGEMAMFFVRLASEGA